MLYALDSAATAWLNDLAGHGRLPDLLMILVAKAGVPAMVLAVAVQWWPRAGRESERHVLVACGLSFLLGLALNQAILLIVHRLRPYDAGITRLLVSPSGDPSFPSDHSTAAFAIAFAFALHRRWRKAVLFAAAAMLVAVSRVYIGIHYVGDVIGGCATALLAAAVVRVGYPEGTVVDRWIARLP